MKFGGNVLLIAIYRKVGVISSVPLTFFQKSLAKNTKTDFPQIFKAAFHIFPVLVSENF